VDRDAWVLHVGDSFVHAFFQQSLRPRFEAAGAAYFVDATNATYTTTWAFGPEIDARLRTWLARRPALVLVTLGANEVDMPAPSEHAGAVRALVARIAQAGAACVWITPPMWKRETGILQVIHDERGPCLFFDSDGALGGLSDDEREPDRIHPNKKGGARWAQSFWEWLGDHRDARAPGWALVPFERR
jgi:lysophospholipase L1-like esterase